MLELHAETIFDPQGQPKAVQLPLKEWEQIVAALEELDDIQQYDAAKQSPQGFIPLDQVIESFGE